MKATGREIRERMERELIREIMTMYDKYRAEWVARGGSLDGFDMWFTKQITERGKV